MTRARLAAWAVVVAACGDDRVMLELHGDVGKVGSLEVILAEPEAFEKLQRNNGIDAPSRPQLFVHYVSQRASVTFDLEPRGVEGLQLQIAKAERYLPVVIARDIDRRVVGIGVYRPEELFDDGGTAAVEQRADLTIYDIAIERVGEREPVTSRPTTLAANELMFVACGPKTSGLVWRRPGLAGIDNELRVVLPLGGGAGAGDRDLDLDCDTHGPGVGTQRNKEGDGKDCDDTLDTSHAFAAEKCNGVDDDCDGERGHVIVQCPMAGCSNVGVCDDANPTDMTLCGTSCRVCKVPWQPSGAVDKSACKSAGELPGICEGGCTTVILLGADLPWDVQLSVANDPALHGKGEAFAAPIGRPVVVHAESTMIWPGMTMAAGTFSVYAESVGGGAAVHAYTFLLETNAGAPCNSPPRAIQCQ